MRTITTIFFFVTLITQNNRCVAGTLDADTIDNWQIYFGDKLVLSGNASIDMTRFFCDTVSYETLTDVKIRFNHCVRTPIKKVTIFITHSDKYNLNWEGEFKPNNSGEYLISFTELVNKRMKGKEVYFEYSEGKWEDRVLLARIYFK